MRLHIPLKMSAVQFRFFVFKKEEIHFPVTGSPVAKRRRTTLNTAMNTRQQNTANANANQASGGRIEELVEVD